MQVWSGDSLLPIGEVNRKALDNLAQDLSATGFRVTVLREAEAPAEAYDARRRQYAAEGLLNLARQAARGRLLAVTDLDLYSENLKFVFGLAESPGRAAVISLHRLRFGADERLFRDTHWACATVADHTALCISAIAWKIRTGRGASCAALAEGK